MSIIFGNFTYDPSKKRWKNNLTGQYTLYGNRLLSKGIYYQLNTDGTVTRVGSVLNGLDKSFIEALKAKGRHENVTLQNAAMRQGLIKDSKLKKWRLDNQDHTTKTLLENGRTYFFSRDGAWKSFDTGLLKSQDQKLLNLKRELYINKNGTNHKYDDNTWSGRIANRGIAGGLVDGLMDGLGVDENSNWRTAGDLASGFLYGIPIVGNIAAAADVAYDIYRGDYGDALTDAAFALIPGGKVVSGLGKGLIKGTGKVIGKTAAKAGLKSVERGLEKAGNHWIGRMLTHNNLASEIGSSLPKQIGNLSTKLGMSSIEKGINKLGNTTLGKVTKTVFYPDLKNASKFNRSLRSGIRLGTLGSGIGTQMVIDNNRQEKATQEYNNLIDKELMNQNITGLLLNRFANYNNNYKEDLNIERIRYTTPYLLSQRKGGRILFAGSGSRFFRKGVRNLTKTTLRDVARAAKLDFAGSIELSLKDLARYISRNATRNTAKNAAKGLEKDVVKNVENDLKNEAKNEAEKVAKNAVVNTKPNVEVSSKSSTKPKVEVVPIDPEAKNKAFLLKKQDLLKKITGIDPYNIRNINSKAHGNSKDYGYLDRYIKPIFKNGKKFIYDPHINKYVEENIESRKHQLLLFDYVNGHIDIDTYKLFRREAKLAFTRNRNKTNYIQKYDTRNPINIKEVTTSKPPSFLQKLKNRMSERSEKKAEQKAARLAEMEAKQAERAASLTENSTSNAASGETSTNSKKSFWKNHKNGFYWTAGLGLPAAGWIYDSINSSRKSPHLPTIVKNQAGIPVVSYDSNAVRQDTVQIVTDHNNQQLADTAQVVPSNTVSQQLTDTAQAANTPATTGDSVSQNQVIINNEGVKVEGMNVDSVGRVSVNGKVNPDLKVTNDGKIYNSKTNKVLATVQLQESNEDKSKVDANRYLVYDVNSDGEKGYSYTPIKGLTADSLGNIYKDNVITKDYSIDGINSVMDKNNNYVGNFVSNIPTTNRNNNSKYIFSDDSNNGKVLILGDDKEYTPVVDKVYDANLIQHRDGSVTDTSGKVIQQSQKGIKNIFDDNAKKYGLDSKNKILNILKLLNQIGLLRDKDVDGLWGQRSMRAYEIFKQLGGTRTDKGWNIPYPTKNKFGGKLKFYDTIYI